MGLSAERLHDNDKTLSIHSQSATNESSDFELWQDLKTFRANHAKNIIFGALNINSVRNKFNYVKNILENGFIDIFNICESKLDSSFPNEQFYVKGYNMYRNDYTALSGGLISWIRNDLPASHRYEYDTHDVNLQTLCIELHLCKEKWFVLSLYRNPKGNIKLFCDKLTYILDKMYAMTSNIIVMGDININMLNEDTKSEKVTELLQVYNLKNCVDAPTCFKGNSPSLIDICFVSKKRRFGSCLNYKCGLSDFHNMIVINTKLSLAKRKPKVIFYRSYKKFDEVNFKTDINGIPFSVLDTFNDIDDKYWMFSKLVMEVIDHHAPVKKKYVKNNCPHMNTSLKKAMYKKRMAHNRYLKDKSNSKNWEDYREKRNAFVKENRISMRNYFKERCKDSKNTKSFWSTIKPYITDKMRKSTDIFLREGDNIVSESSEVANVFNDYFVSVIKDFGFDENVNDNVDQAIHDYVDHESVKRIRNRGHENDFCFYHTDVKQIEKMLCKVNCKKSTGYDNFPSKLLKIASVELAPSICSLINNVIDQKVFPCDLKNAEVSPIYKKDDTLDKSNYRPISILSCVSKIFEKVIDTQFSSHFYENYAFSLSAYRKKHNTQSVLLKVVEDIKVSLDKGLHVGGLLVDLSKAFDVIPHNLLIAKLNAYGYANDDVQLILSYLNNRKQRVKICNARSTWSMLSKGVPQGSILGPTLFNTFINDLFLCIDNSFLHNYADDNSLVISCKSPSELKKKLEENGDKMTEWFCANGLKANPDKYQAIVFGSNSTSVETITIKSCKITCTNSAKLLGIHIDSELSFNEQVRNVCKKASRQINVIMRLSKLLDTDVKLTMYRSFIFSNFNYCPAIWLMCSQANMKKLEKLNCRALRFVYDDYVSSYEELLLKNNHSSISVHYMHCLASEVYKCINDIAPEYLRNIFVKQNHGYSLRDHCSLIQNRFKTVKYGYNSFGYLGAKIWNKMSINIKNSTCYEDFSLKLKDWTDCSCLMKLN